MSKLCTNSYKKDSNSQRNRSRCALQSKKKVAAAVERTAPLRPPSSSNSLDALTPHRASLSFRGSRTLTAAGAQKYRGHY